MAEKKVTPKAAESKADKAEKTPETRVQKRKLRKVTRKRVHHP